MMRFLPSLFKIYLKIFCKVLKFTQMTDTKL